MAFNCFGVCRWKRRSKEGLKIFFLILLILIKPEMVTRDQGKTGRGNTLFCELQLLPDAEEDLVKAGKDTHTNTHIPAFITLLTNTSTYNLLRLLKALVKLTSKIKQKIIGLFDCNRELLFVLSFLYLFVDRTNQPCTSPASE